MAVFFNFKNTRFIAFLSFVGVLCYYGSGDSRPRVDKASVQVNQGGRAVDVMLSRDEVESYVRGFREQRLQDTKHEEEEEEEEEEEAPPQPPPQPPSEPPQALPREVHPDKRKIRPASVNSTKYVEKVVMPVMKPSSGAFLKQIDISGHNKKERKFLRRHRKVLSSRAEILSNECSKRSALAESGPVNFVWDTKHTPNVLFCPIYKVGSTSWMINFLRLAHFNDDNPDLLKMKAAARMRNKFKHKYGASQNQVYKLYPPPADQEERFRIFNNSLRMVVVRHPYARIISAYRDKMSKLNPLPKEHNFRQLQLDIIAKYRQQHSKETSPFPTFPEFVQHVIDSTKLLRTRKDWLRNVKCWTPYWVQCNVCASDFNLIMKLETMDEDEIFLTTIADMKELKKEQSYEWRHQHGNTTSYDLMKTYMSQLTKNQRLQLQQRYLLDFILFDYNEREWLKSNSDE